MKCKCGNDIKLNLGLKLATTGCEILTSVTTIVTVKCNKCKAVFQIPVSSQAFAIDKSGKPAEKISK
jgi:hypothetical protein